MADQGMQGTPIEDIEMGNVKNEADSELMRQILAEMNAAEPVPETPEMPQQPQQMPMYQQMPQMPQMPQQQMQRPYAPVFEEPNMQVHEYDEYETHQPPKKPKYKPAPAIKKNGWSQMFETLREPLLVGLLIAVLLFPKLHTLGSNYIPWAYSVGGQVSWLGLLGFSVLGAGTWALYKFFA